MTDGAGNYARRIGEAGGELLRLQSTDGTVVGCLLVKRIVSFHTVPSGSRINLADGNHVVVEAHIRDVRWAILETRTNNEPALTLVSASWY